VILPSLVEHVVILSGQITVVMDCGEVWTLGREGGMRDGALEWQKLPTIPQTEAWEAEQMGHSDNVRLSEP
jgi:hypothetical protein